MKKAITIMVLFLCSAFRADACVGKVLHIGVVDSPEGQILAEMLSSLIIERTGSSVTVQFYENEKDLDEAMTAGKADISVGNTREALSILNRPAEPDADKAYEVVKAAYERDKGLVWLKPFGFVHRAGSPSASYTAAVLRMDILNNFPALPRVIGKLGGTMSDDVYAKLLRSLESGEKPKKVARDFLKSKKLI